MAGLGALRSSEVVWEQRVCLGGFWNCDLVGVAGRESRDAALTSWLADVGGLRATHGSYRSTPYSAYNPETYSGHWKQLTVRTSRRGQAMAIVYFHPQVSGRVAFLGEGVWATVSWDATLQGLFYCLPRNWALRSWLG